VHRVDEADLRRPLRRDVLAVNASSAKCPALMIAGRRCSEPRSATSATLASRTEKMASLDARRMSQALMKSTPAPMQ